MTNTNPQDPPIEPTGAEPPVEPRAEPAPQPTDPAQTAEPHGADGDPADSTDWKAMARKWEKQAKDNKEAADELAALKESSAADIEAANQRAKAAEDELAKLQAANARADAVRSAAKAANVDESVLSRMTGETPEEIADNARMLAAATQPRAAYPTVNDGGAGGQVHGMTLEQINAIKDPTERVMMRAKYPNAI